MGAIFQVHKKILAVQDFLLEVALKQNGSDRKGEVSAQSKKRDRLNIKSGLGHTGDKVLHATLDLDKKII